MINEQGTMTCRGGSSMVDAWDMRPSKVELIPAIARGGGGGPRRRTAPAAGEPSTPAMQ
jgi:hypothetical protein